MSGDGWKLSIDFGTANTTAAHGTDGEAPAVLEVEGSRYLPSVVFADKSGQLLTGKAAAQKAAVSPERAVRAPKRALVAGEKVVLEGRVVEVADLIAAVLARMYGEAVRFHGEQPPTRVVMTHPARWGEALTGRLRDAGARAGISAPELVPEPQAAAWWYAPPEPGQVLGVFDLGGGTLDTAVLEVDESGFKLAGPPGGDADLGGEDFDELLLERVSHEARNLDEAAWRELFADDSPRSRRDRWRLRQDVVTAKEALSQYPAYDLAIGGYAEEFRLTRPEFEELIGGVIETAIGEMRRTIFAAGLEPGQLTALYLTGGASRVPAVATQLATALGIVPRMENDPKAVVVLGALKAQTRPAKPVVADPEPDVSPPISVQDLPPPVVTPPITTVGSPPIAIPDYSVQAQDLQWSGALTGNIVVERIAVSAGAWAKIGDPLFMLRGDNGTATLWSTYIGQVRSLEYQQGQQLVAGQPLLTMAVSGWLFKPNARLPFDTGVLLACAAPPARPDGSGAAASLLVTVDNAGSRPVPMPATCLLYVPQGNHLLSVVYEATGGRAQTASQVIKVRRGKRAALSYEPPRNASSRGKLRS